MLLDRRRGGTVRVSAAVDNIDPADAFDLSKWSVLATAYDGLVGYRRAAYGAGDVLVGALATDVPEPTDGGRRYAFTLRDGLPYSDGQPVRASDFGPSLARALRLNADLNPDYYTAIVGVPATRSISAVRWKVTGQLVGAWFLTFPICAAIGYVVTKTLRMFW